MSQPCPLPLFLKLLVTGYKQELKRELNLLRNFAVSFGLLSMLTGLGGFYYYGFTYGGPAVVIWGWILVVSMTLTIALSMAEICSSLPSAGGVYYWSVSAGGLRVRMRVRVCKQAGVFQQGGKLLCRELPLTTLCAPPHPHPLCTSGCPGWQERPPLRLDCWLVQPAGAGNTVSKVVHVASLVGRGADAESGRI